MNVITTDKTTSSNKLILWPYLVKRKKTTMEIYIQKR